LSDFASRVAFDNRSIHWNFDAKQTLFFEFHEFFACRKREVPIRKKEKKTKQPHDYMIASKKKAVGAIGMNAVQTIAS